MLSKEERLSVLSAKVSKNLERLSSDEINLEEKYASLQVINNDLSKLSAVLRQLEVDLKTASILSEDNDIEAQKSKLQLATSNLLCLTEQFNTNKVKIERLKLLGERKEEVSASTSDGNDILFSQNDSLSRAKQRLAETEEVASGVTENLFSNREKIQSSMGRSQETGGLLGQSQQVIDKMLRRENQRKTITQVLKYLAAFILVVYICKTIF